jgi:hypothetical protein
MSVRIYKVFCAVIYRIFRADLWFGHIWFGPVWRQHDHAWSDYLAKHRIDLANAGERGNIGCQRRGIRVDVAAPPGPDRYLSGSLVEIG